MHYTYVINNNIWFRVAMFPLRFFYGSYLELFSWLTDIVTDWLLQHTRMQEFGITSKLPTLHNMRAVFVSIVDTNVDVCQTLYAERILSCNAFSLVHIDTWGFALMFHSAPIFSVVHQVFSAGTLVSLMIFQYYSAVPSCPTGSAIY